MLSAPEDLGIAIRQRLQLSAALEVRAEKRGTTVGEQARQILLEVLGAPEDLGIAIRQRLQSLGGVDFEPPAREPIQEPPDLTK